MDRISKYPNILEKLLKEKGPATNGQLYRFGLNNGYLPKHTKQALELLASAGKKIDVESLDGKPAINFYFNDNGTSVIEKNMSKIQTSKIQTPPLVICKTDQDKKECTNSIKSSLL